MPNLKENLNYPRRMVIYAVFDVLDRMGSRYDQIMTGDIKAEVTVLGHTSLFAFAVTELSQNSSILHITMVREADGLTIEEKKLDVRYMMDRILHHMAQNTQTGHSISWS